MSRIKRRSCCDAMKYNVISEIPWIAINTSIDSNCRKNCKNLSRWTRVCRQSYFTHATKQSRSSNWIICIKFKWKFVAQIENDKKHIFRHQKPNYSINFASGSPWMAMWFQCVPWFHSLVTTFITKSRTHCAKCTAVGHWNLCTIVRISHLCSCCACANHKIQMRANRSSINTNTSSSFI